MRFFKTFHPFPPLPAFADRKLLECGVFLPISKGSTPCFPEAGVSVLKANVSVSMRGNLVRRLGEEGELCREEGIRAVFQSS